MNLTDEIKEKLRNAKSEEEAKAILKDIIEGAKGAGIIIDDDDLEKVAGGFDIDWADWWDWFIHPNKHDPY